MDAGKASIRRRIYLGFGIVLALLAVQLGAALRGLDRIRGLREEIVHRYDPPSQAAQDLEHGVLHRAIALRNFVVTRDRRHEREFERQHAAYGEGLHRLEGMALDAGSRAALGAVSSASGDHLVRTSEFQALFRRGAPARELAAAEARLGDAREELLARIRAFDGLQRQRQAEARARMAATQDEVVRALVVAALLAALALGVTAVVTTRAVRRPALALVEASRAIERGDYAAAAALAPAADVSPRAELPQLAAAFARMADALHRRELRTAADARLAARLAASLDPETTAHAAIDEIARFGGAELAAVFLVEDGALRRVAGRAAEGTPATLPRDGILAEALATGRPVLVERVPDDLPFSVHVGFGVVRPRAAVAVPLASRGEAIGVLLLGSFDPLSADTVAFAVDTGRHLAVALHNALYHLRVARFAAELEEQNEQLQAQNEELQAQGEEIHAQSEELVAQGDEIRRHNDELAAAKEALAAKAAALEEVDRRKNEFLATLGHELRNPLAAVATAGTLLEGEARDGRVTRRARIISRQVRNLRRLVDDLLDLSRINHGKIDLRLERMDAASAVDGAIQAVRAEADGKAQRISFRRGMAPLPVDADPVRLEQVVSNLLRNAVKYTPAEGTITVAAEADGCEAVIRVGDTGMGIAPELLPKIFEPFVQGTHSEGGDQGLGLGLALVRRLVEMHGGRVDARSDGEGTGTVFVIRLPLAGVGAVAEAPTQPRPVPEGADGSVRVLVVEDDPDVATTTVEALELFGFTVRVESDADAGLRACLESPPDVALLDIGLPGRDGYDLARDIRARLPRHAVRLVAVTGYGQPEDRARAFAAGFDHHLVKPVELDELRSVIERLASGDGDEVAA